MLRHKAILFSILLTGCASTPQVVSVPVSVPCPERLAIERPVLTPIPPDAAFDQIAVMVNKHLLQIMQYAAGLEKAKGC